MPTFTINVTTKHVHTFELEARTRTEAVLQLGTLLTSDDPFHTAETVEIDRRVSTPMKIGDRDVDVPIDTKP